MRGSNYPSKRPHAYDSYISSVDWIERIISEGVEENSKKWLLTDIASFLNEEYGVPNSHPNQPAMWKAVELMDGYEREIPENVMAAEPVVRDKSARERKIIFKKMVEEAHQKGYMENFRLAEPWHPAAFLSGDFVSYPYQHNTAIVYRGITRDNYYLEEQKPEDKGGSMRNPISILNQGYLNPGNSFNDDNEDAVWTTPFLQTAQGYGSRQVDNNSGIVLEIQAPTKWIQCGAHGVRLTHNLEEIQQEFGSPENYRNHVQGGGVNVSLLLRPKLPIKYVTGVWDLQFFDEPYFIPLQSDNQVDAIDLAHRHQEGKMPKNPRIGEAGFQDETQKFIRMSKIESRLEEDVRALVNLIEGNIENIKHLNLGDEKRYGRESEFRGLKVEALLDKIISSIDGDDENRKRTLNYLINNIFEIAEEFGVSPEKKVVQVSSFKELHSAVANLLKQSRKLEDITQEINVDLENKEITKDSLEDFNEVLQDLYRIEIDRESVLETIENSSAELRNEILSVEEAIKRDFRLIKWIYKMDSQLNKVIQDIESVHNNGRMTRQQLYEIDEAMDCYENTGDKEYGVNEILKRGRQKLSISKEVNPQKAEALSNLEKACKKRFSFIEGKKSELNQIEEEFENIIEEIENIKEGSISGEYQQQVKDELDRIEEEHERLTSKEGFLYQFYRRMNGVDWDYRMFKSKVESQSSNRQQSVT